MSFENRKIKLKGNRGEKSTYFFFRIRIWCLKYNPWMMKQWSSETNITIPLIEAKQNIKNPVLKPSDRLLFLLKNICRKLSHCQQKLWMNKIIWKICKNSLWKKVLSRGKNVFPGFCFLANQFLFFLILHCQLWKDRILNSFPR